MVTALETLAVLVGLAIGGYVWMRKNAVKIDNDDDFFGGWI